MSDQHITCSDCGSSFIFTAAEQSFYAEKGLAAPPKRCKDCRAARKARDGAGGGARGESRGRFDGPRGGGNDRRGAGAGRGGTGFGGGGYDRGAPRSGGFNGGGARSASAPRSGGFNGGSRTGGGYNAGAPRGGNAGYGAPNDRRGGGTSDRRNDAPRSDWGRDANRRSNPSDRRDTAPRAASVEAPPAKKRADRPEKAKFDITCATCGTQAQVPFKPLDGRQVYCQPCYRARKGSTHDAAEAIDVGEADNGIVE